MLTRSITNTILAMFLAGAGGTVAAAQSATFRTTDGQSVSLSQLRGQIVVLSFGGTWVPIEAKELPALQKVAERYTPRGVKVFWVSINSSREGARNYISDENLQAFALKNGFRDKVLRDADLEAYRAFNLDAIPTVIIIDRQGNVAKKYVGFGTDPGESYNEIIRTVEQMLK